MPVLSDDQLLQNIRYSNGEFANLPVIVISASRNGKQVANDAGVTAYVEKPFDFQELMDTVNEHIS